MEGGQESRRRVSFAAEPQINYIYQKENSTSMTSLCSVDMPMDIVTELAELKNLNLFTADEGPEESGDVEADHAADVPMKRMSLDPLKFAEVSSFHENTQANISNLINFELGRPQEQEECDKDRTQPIFWHASVKNEPRKSLNASFEDTGVINSSFGVEELVNTIDLRRIIPQEWQEKTTVGEFLASQGIRFLDETVISAMKRDTLSKSRNTVDPALVVYYKYSLSERIEFLYNFSSFLIDKMKDLQREVEQVEAGIDVGCINKDNLKKVRNEARNKAKIDWYSLRKIYEIQFNKKMIENKNKVLEIVTSTRREHARNLEAIAQKEESVGKLRSKIAELKDRVLKFDKENIQKTEKLQAMIDERKKVYESAKDDLETARQTFEAQRKEEIAVQKKIERLHNEISNLKKNIAIKNVSENQLEEIKGLLARYASIFQFKLRKITKHSLTFEIAANVVAVEINSLSEAVGITVVESDGDPFNEFARALVQTLGPMKLVDLVRRCLDAFYLCFSLRKEVNIIKEKAKIECFYLNSSLYLRIHPAESRIPIDLSVNNSLNLVWNEEVQHNLKTCPGALSVFIAEKLSK